MKTILIVVVVFLIFIGLFGVIYYLNVKNEFSPGEEENFKEEEIDEIDNSIADSCIELGCPEGSIYVGSVNSDKYYLCTCHYAQRINPENIVCFSSDEKALADERENIEC